MSKFRRGLASKPLIIIAFIVIFAAIGGYLLFKSRAATPFVAQEAEGGSVSSPATVISDSTASGGKAIQFNAQPTSGAFMSYPLQTSKLSVSGGTNVVISNKSFRGVTGSPAVTVSGATNVYIHDVDFDSNSGDIFLINVSGTIRIENIRARNTGAGRTTNGSGNGEVIQFNNTWQGAPASDTTAGVRNVKNYGGNTEDMISIFRSGGLDASHPLIIESNHLESPLPGSADGALAWTSGSGTCINAADDDPATGDGGHDIIIRNNTLLNCGTVGLQMNRPLRVTDTGNILYGAARPSPNSDAAGLSQWSSHSCASCINNFYTNNRVWWLKPDGTKASQWFSSTATITTSGNTLNDTTIDPNSLKVVL